MIYRYHCKDHCTQFRQHHSVDERQVGLTPSDVVGKCAHALIVVIAVVHFKYYPLKRGGFLSVREYVLLIAYRLVVCDLDTAW